MISHPRPCSLGRPGSAPVFATAFSRDGTRLAAGDGEGGVSLWDVTGDAPVVRRTIHDRAVRALTFAGDGASLATGSTDGTARLWRNCPTGDPRMLRRSGVWSLTDLCHGRWLAVGGDCGHVIMCNADTGAARWVERGHRGPVLALAASPDGRVVASAGEDGVIVLHDAETGQELQRLPHHLGAVNCLAYSPRPGSPLLAAGGDDMTVSIWNLMGGQRQVLHGHWGLVEALAFAPDGHLLASGGQDGTVRLWDVATWQPRTVLQGPEGPIWSVAFAPDGTSLAAGCEDGTVRLWDFD